MNWVVRTLTDTEMQMSSVERIKHYTNVEREKSVIQGKVATTHFFTALIVQI